jgi:RNA polymerase sigma-70 factor (ECF subfamily)
MAEETRFQELIRRVRAGDQQAAAELVRTYEPAIRRVVRLRLRDDRLRRQFDSMDVCQSVLASFFVRVALGQYELEQAGHLVNLLTKMAQYKVADQARRQRTECRDLGRIAGGVALASGVADRGDGPEQQVALDELLEEFRSRLSPEEAQLAELRAQGRGWEEIAAELGDSPEALRKRLTRAVERVARQLDLDEVTP